MYRLPPALGRIARLESGPSFDPDSIDFFIRAGVTDPVVKRRHDRVVRWLKSTYSIVDGLPLWVHLHLWYGADAGAMHDVSSVLVPAADGETVHTWLNRKSDSLHISQVTATAQPLLRAPSDLFERAAVKFDGVDDYMLLPSITVNSRRTQIITYRHNAISNWRTLYSYRQFYGQRNSSAYADRNISPTLCKIDQNDNPPYDNSSIVGVTGSISSTLTNYVAIIQNGHNINELKLWRNKELIASSEDDEPFVDTDPRTVPLYLGQQNNSNYLNGLLGDYMVIDGHLTETQRNDLTEILS